MLSIVATRRRLTNQLTRYGYQVWHCNLCRKRILTDALFLSHLKTEHGLDDKEYRRLLSGATEALKLAMATESMSAAEATSRVS
jgi:hypothetical protein